MDNLDKTERQWEMIQMLLDAGMQGKPVHAVASKRTLFGVPSHVEQVVERTAREMDRRAGVGT